METIVMQLENPLVKRVLTSLILIPTSLALIFYVPFTLKASALILICALMAFEWAKLAKVRFGEYVFPAIIAAMGYCFVQQLPHPIYAAFLIPLMIAYYPQDKIFCAGAIYLSVASFCLLEILKLDPKVFFWLLLVTWSGDIFAFFVGRTLKGPKLWVTVSPNKTWSGLVGGILAAAIIAGIYGLYHNLFPYPFILSLALSLLGHGGDLLESAAKRYYNSKDSGNLIPGHGGILDRLDSLLMIGIGFMLVRLLLG